MVDLHALPRPLARRDAGLSLVELALLALPAHLDDVRLMISLSHWGLFAVRWFVVPEGFVLINPEELFVPNGLIWIPVPGGKPGLFST